MVDDADMSPEAFAHSLATLHAEGVTVLVIGDVGPSSHARACEIFSDSAGHDPTVLVATDGTCHDAWERQTGNQQTVHLRYISDQRSVSTDINASSEADTRECVYTPLDIAEKIHAEFEQFEHGMMASERPRVCIESLSPLIADHGIEEVRSGIHRIALSMESSGGFAHLHLPIPFTHDAVQSLLHECRCVVELAREGTEIRHRWHFPERATQTAWHPLQPLIDPTR